MTIEAKIIADSISNEGIRITTMQLKYPRFVHAEFMTHRVFSRNASSSRAIPVKRIMASIMEEPALPVFWGSNKPGMQAGAELTGDELKEVQNLWRDARDQMVEKAEQLVELGLHKQLANRILEPWSHINVLVTATDYNNFFALRRHPDAQPEIKELADCMWEAMKASNPRLLDSDQWHLPYVTDEEQEMLGFDSIKVSVARCARVSYKNFDGSDTDIDADLTLYDRLLGGNPIHASPAEHQAKPDYKGIAYENGGFIWKHRDLHGNFHGWVQYRKSLPNEHIVEYDPSR